MVEIRATLASDAEALRTIRLKALQSDPTAFGAAYDDVVHYEAAEWARRATGSDDVVNFFAVLDDEVVGMVAGLEMPDRPGHVELVSMWTDPVARGLGVGQRLVDVVVTWAADRGTPEVRLWVTRGNDSALRLYQRCGFELTDEVGVAPSDPCREEQRMTRRSQA